MFTYKSIPAEEIGLKPCPWCGNSDVRLIRDEICFYVWCNTDLCKRSRIKCFATEKEAIEDWNGGEADDLSGV